MNNHLDFIMRGGSLLQIGAQHFLQGLSWADMNKSRGEGVNDRDTRLVWRYHQALDVLSDDFFTMRDQLPKFQC